MPPGPWPIEPNRADLSSIFWWTLGIVWALITMVSAVTGRSMVPALIIGAAAGGLVVLVVHVYRRVRAR
jgi:hypothetical protein